MVEYVDARVVHFTGVVGHGEEPDPLQTHDPCRATAAPAGDDKADDQDLLSEMTSASWSQVDAASAASQAPSTSRSTPERPSDRSAAQTGIPRARRENSRTRSVGSSTLPAGGR